MCHSVFDDLREALFRYFKSPTPGVVFLAQPPNLRLALLKAASFDLRRWDCDSDYNDSDIDRAVYTLWQDLTAREHISWNERDPLHVL